MEITDVITEDNNIRELDTINADTNICSILPVDSSISSSSTSSTESNSSDSMETSDDESTDYIPSDISSGMTDSDSDDSMSLSSESSQSDRDSSSDYYPSEASMEISSSEESTDSEDFSPLVDEDHYVPETKKRKRNPLDSFCLYSIRPNNPDDTNLYIGSTVNFNRRKQQHKKAVSNRRGGTYYCILYRYIRKCGGWDNFTMEKILDYPCETKQQGLLKEKEYIIKHEATLNSIMPISESV
jgi:hypothetical protein